MTLKTVLSVVAVLVFSKSLYAQNSKSFVFSEIKTPNIDQEWSNTQIVSQRTANFSSTQITLDVDKNYNLQIISKTDLPDKGVIYLCKDDAANSVTIMLINNLKMFLYSNGKRFLINFEKIYKPIFLADND